MKLTVLTNAPYPNGTVTTHRVHNICKGLLKNGVDVEIVITNPTEKKGKVLNDNGSGSSDGVEFSYLGLSTERHSNRFIRKIRTIYYHYQLILTILFKSNREDLFLVIGPGMDYRFLLPIMGKIFGKKIILEVNEYPFVGNRKKWIFMVKQWLFLNFNCPFYSGFIVISEALQDLINKHKSSSAKVIKVPILANEVIHKNKDKRPLNEPYILHTGSYNEDKDGIIGILKAYELVHKKVHTNLKYVFTGSATSSPDFHKIMGFIKEKKLEKHVFFTGFVSRQELDNYYSHACLALINKYDTLQNQYCFATKITEYITYGIPMILTNVGEVKSFFKTGVNAFVLEPEDTEMLAHTIMACINKSNDLVNREIVKNAELLLKRDFNISYQGERLKKFFLQI